MRSQQQQGSNSRPMQSNVVNFDVREIFPDEDPTEYYPAETRCQPGRPRKNAAPYAQNKGKAPVTIKPRPKPTIKEVDEFNQNIQRMIDKDNRNNDTMEAEAESTRKLRKTKMYEYHAWNDIKDQRANISFQQLAQVAPVIKQQIRARLSEINPGFRIT